MCEDGEILQFVRERHWTYCGETPSRVAILLGCNWPVCTDCCAIAVKE